MLKQKSFEYDNEMKDDLNNKNTHQFELIFSPRTTYSNELNKEETLYNDLTLNFDPITINIVKKHFKERLGSLNKIEFIAILKNHLLSWHPNLPDREKMLVKLLSRLFGEIDLNDNGSMEWSEFCNYIIHNSNSVSNKHDTSTFRLRCYSLSRNTIDTIEFKESISYCFYIEKHSLVGIVEEGKCFVHFYDANTLRKLNMQIDLKSVSKDLEDPEDYDEKESLILDETKDKKNKIEIVTTKRKKVGIVFKRLTILSTLFIIDNDILLISSSNKRITSWKYHDGAFSNVNTPEKRNMNFEKNLSTFSVLVSSSPQYTMAWDNIGKNLYTGQNDGKINKWDLSRGFPIGVLDMVKELKFQQEKKQKESEDKIKEDGRRKESRMTGDNLDIPLFKGKKTMNNTKDDKKLGDSVTALVVITKIQVLAASYLNGKIFLWDILQMKTRKIYELKNAVYNLTYDASKNLLFSCGKDHDIYVFDPYIEFPVYVLSGHVGSVSTVTCNDKENELISLDIYGNIKIWDSQLFVCFQSINLNESAESMKIEHNRKENNRVSNNIKVTYLKKQKKILVYHKKIVFFETDKSLNPELADDQVIFACFYDKATKSIISFSLRKIKMWNPLTGKMKNAYEDPMKNEITAIALDKNMKRVFLGDNTGKIKCFNMKNGKFLKDLTPHKLEVNMLVHSLSLNKVVSCSVDNTIMIHDDTELMETTLIKEIKIYSFQVKCIMLMELSLKDDDILNRLVIGLSNGLIKFYDIDHFRYDSDIINESKDQVDEVNCLYVFNDHPVVFSGHSKGNCKFMWTPPSPQKFNYFLTFPPKDDLNTKLTPLTALDYDQENKRMFCGDQLGVIKCYCFKNIFSILDDLKENPVEDKLINDRFKDIQLVKLWSIEAHKESIKHLNYTNINPNLIITTSHDLRIKLYNANNGIYLDELKQSSSKYPSVPISIKYRGIDPITKNLNVKEVERKTISKYDLIGADEIENIPISEYSKQVNLLNAKEKLLSYVKHSKLGPDQSNYWNFNIDVNSLKEEEESNLMEIWEKVKKQEIIVIKTEMIMQQKSIYHASYKPLFINEIDKEQIKEFSNNLSNKLRQIKLAISKANLNMNKNSTSKIPTSDIKMLPSPTPHKKTETFKKISTEKKDMRESKEDTEKEKRGLEGELKKNLKILDKTAEKKKKTDLEIALQEKRIKTDEERKITFGLCKNNDKQLDLRRIEEDFKKNSSELDLIINGITKFQNKYQSLILPQIKSPKI